MAVEISDALGAIGENMPQNSGLCSLEVVHLDVYAALHGEERLASFLQRLSATLRREFPSAVVEFSALEHGYRIWFDHALDFAQTRLQAALSLVRRELCIGFVCGFTVFEKGLHKEEAILQASLARRSARQEGRSFLTYEQLGLKYEAGLRGWASLRTAMSEDRIYLQAQEIKSVIPVMGVSGYKRQFEVLMQMVDDQGQILPLDQVLFHAERDGMIANLDSWLLRRVLVGYGKALLRAPEISLSLNVSGMSISQKDFWPYLQGLLEQSCVRPEQLQIEITETAQIADMACARDNVMAMRKAGLDVALDDFGAAYSGSIYLAALPVNVIKLDGALVSKLIDPIEGARSLIILRAMVETARALSITVVAEYVSCHEIEMILRQLGVDKLQGFALGKPLPLNQVFV